jgi:hypothetical protein
MEINNLIQKYLSRKNQQTYPWELISDDLEVIFSKEFIQIAEYCRFDYFDNFEWLSADKESDNSLFSYTKFMRDHYHLPKEYVLLADDGTSCVLMKCMGDREETYWIDREDVLRICDGEKPAYTPDIFSTFVDFFEYLLDGEEKIKADEPE